jgi:hypothetical protein
MQPAYRVVEGVSDGVYNFMRSYVVGNLWADESARGLRMAPEEDSARLFDENLRKQELLFVRQTREAYPVTSEASGPFDSALIAGWRSRTIEGVRFAAAVAVKETLRQRYRLEFFDSRSDSYLWDRSNWDPGSLALAGVVGGFLFYLDGMRATAKVADWDLAIDLRSGLRFQQFLRQGAANARLASLKLGRGDKPLALVTEWGLANGRLASRSVGFEYRLRY